jgi:NADH:ubiquinone oxidoreductase subunit 5 (subunit L)/multisubunit Na+/H+ antiporter MnhA subunit
MNYLITFIPLLPFLAATTIGSLHLFGILDSEKSERTTARIANYTIGLSCLLALILLTTDLLGQNPDSIKIGQWLQVDDFSITLSLITSGFSVKLAALFSVLLFIVTRFSINYLHREAGFHRFFFVLSLFSSAMLMLVLSANMVGTFIGWEIAGLCSYLLIAYMYDRPTAAHNATRVFITNRIGDGGFIAGIGLSYFYLHSSDWLEINTVANQLSDGQANLIALCFTLAALVKSAQFPFTPWVARAMEGPTPSSAIFYGAVMIHSGVYLLFLIRPVLEHAPLVMALIAVLGLITAIYAYLVGLTQTDIKSSLIFATSGQLGLLFLECGLGFWQLAAWHLCAHAMVRAYQFLTAPSLLVNVANNPIKPVHPFLANNSRFYTYAVQRFWLEPATDWLLTKPLLCLASDLNYFDKQIIDPLMGSPAPAVRAISTLAQAEERKIGAHLDNTDDTFAQGSGLAGKLTQWSAALLHWFETRFVLHGVSKDAIHYGRHLGHIANRVEQNLLKPRYLVLFVFITLLVAF